MGVGRWRKGLKLRMEKITLVMTQRVKVGRKGMKGGTIPK